MPTHMQCPHCIRALVIPDDFTGTRARCPACNNSVEIAPAEAEPATTAVPVHASAPPNRFVLVGVDIPFVQVFPIVAKVFAAWMICSIPLVILYLLANAR